ncbi:uncharacterized protein LOC126951158 isoform X3 [Macaca thibetana thibetana]|uniref:uncharacterized protein LOC126951158 isoform X3 n=1 Tax=Macaca thibetana thibetana TaxID=257877 RepID=UPI0021BC42F8|nr:uncharacterized protein LOC126951158 isoform X3 [Macaca thibetana thibetana]
MSSQHRSFFLRLLTRAEPHYQEELWGARQLRVQGEKDLAQREERSEAEPETQERKLTPRTPGPGDVPSQNLPSQDALEKLGWDPHLGQERAELQRPPRMDSPQSLREEDPQDQKADTPQHKRGEASRGEIKDAPQHQRVKTQRGQSPRAPQGQREEAPLGENTGVPQSRREFSPKCQGKASPQSLGKMLRSWEGNISQAWEVAPGEALYSSQRKAAPGAIRGTPAGP